MTLEEKRDAVIELCDKYSTHEDGVYCKACPCSNILTGFCAIDGWWEDASEQELDKALKLFGKEEPVEPDMINHPSHYCREGAIESIDEMVMLFGKEVVKHFCLCNIHKYRYRASSKNGEQDLKKSDWYARKYKELSESDE